MVLILAMLGGVGRASLSRCRSDDHRPDRRLRVRFGRGTAEQPILPPPPDEPAATAAADSGKNTDRLLPGEAPPPGSDVRVVGDAPAARPPMPGRRWRLAEPVPASADAGVDTGAGGQKAILYEEPVEGAGADAAVTAVDAVVTSALCRRWAATAPRSRRISVCRGGT